MENVKQIIFILYFLFFFIFFIIFFFFLLLLVCFSCDAHEKKVAIKNKLEKLKVETSIFNENYKYNILSEYIEPKAYESFKDVFSFLPNLQENDKKIFHINNPFLKKNYYTSYYSLG